MSKAKLKFIKPAFAPSLINCTTRLGNKWTSLAGSDVEVCDTKGNVIFESKITHTLTKRFIDIKENEIENQHSKETRTLSGLFDAMKEAYGEDFYADSLVTIVHFSVPEPYLYSITFN